MSLNMMFFKVIPKGTKINHIGQYLSFYKCTNNIGMTHPIVLCCQTPVRENVIKTGKH